MSDMLSPMPPGQPLRRPPSLTQRLVDLLSDRIRTCEIPPGAKLPTESQIMREHHVSRTVVREAISSLQAAGLVETRHGIGTFVLNEPAAVDLRLDSSVIITVRDILAILELRIVLESEASALAAARRSDEQLSAMRRALEEFQAELDHGYDTATPDYQFHLQVAYATGNRYFADIMGHLGMATIPRTRVSALKSDAEKTSYLSLVQRQHHDVYDAVLRRDPEGARAAMRLHLAGSRDRFRRLYQTAEDGAVDQRC